MFGIGVAEFFAVLVLALIVLGPERLPLAMRTLGRWVRQLRQMTREFRKEFAEEFSILYEEMDVLRQEAENTRQELADIRAELSDTLHGAADDVNVASQGIAEDLRGAVGADQDGAEASPAASGTSGGSTSAPALPEQASTSTTSASPTLPSAASDSASTSSGAQTELLPAADAMALAIQDTFAPESNGQVDVALPVAASEETPQPVVDGKPTIPQSTGQGLSAYAPDVNGPTEPEAPPPLAEPHSVAAPAPDPAQTAATAAITPDELEAPVAALGPPTPGLQNQMGGFMRLMVMQAIDADPDFAEQAEAALRSQARADAEGLGDLEDPEPLGIAQAWAARRRHLVPHDSVEVDQRAESSAVIEFGVCPYGLTPGKDHPVCSVSNVYDDEFFKQFDMKATYTTRMSDGADRCQLIILTHARMRQFGLKIEDDDKRERDEAAAEHEAVF
ncbi:MAG: Sec-independent protein translocase protein TatB [Chloroflexota bacterium]|nr:Sec-independent protein translocase protein TatB [Chloroflexota bacterium]